MQMSSPQPIQAIAQPAPTTTVGWLWVPLTAERKAALAAFEARTGVSAADRLADLLDAEIFSLSSVNPKSS
jgi:hypothetical protein